MAEGNGTVSNEPQGLVQLVKRYRRAVAVGGIAAVAAVAGIAVYLISCNTGPEPDTAAAGKLPGKSPVTVAGEVYEYLPATTRAKAYAPEEEPATAAVVKDPFAGPMALVGVVLGGRGGNLAIIEAGGFAYVAAEGDTLAGVWQVAEIQKNGVLLKAGERERRLELSGRKGASGRSGVQ